MSSQKIQHIKNKGEVAVLVKNDLHQFLANPLKTKNSLPLLLLLILPPHVSLLLLNLAINRVIDMRKARIQLVGQLDFSGFQINHKNPSPKMNIRS